MDAVNTGASRQGGRQRACADYQKRQARDMLAFQEAMNAVFLEALRVAKPGAHLLAFGGTRTYHRLACAIEDAGWEIRDCVMWVYGSGFPKSHDVSKAIDKAAGAEREVVGQRVYGDGHVQNSTRLAPPIGTFQRTQDERLETAPATDAARQWSGWGTALKPAWEPIIVARKPLCGTVAENVLRHGTGGINVDGCRVGTDGGTRRDGKADKPNDAGWENMRGHGIATLNAGRWPANVIHDGGDEVERLAGSAARFFYCAKASKADRDEGCEGLPQVVRACGPEGHTKNATAKTGELQRHPRGNHHPTVKPTALMRYLCRLVTPPGGVVLDPFTGSGSTGKAATLEGFRFIGIEREAEYVEIARARIAAVNADRPLLEAV